MKHAILASTLLLGPAVAVAQQPLKVGKLSASEPRTIATFDVDDLKGQPARLAWSADGKQLYLQTLEGERGKPGATLSHYIFSVEDGRRENVPQEPAWATASWAAKSDRSSPDDPALLIQISTSRRTERMAAAPMGGDMARGGTGAGGDVGGGAGGATAAEVGDAAAGAQSVTVNALKLRNETIGEFVNAVPMPGLTFGWGPKGSGAMAFVSPKNGRIVIMDVAGGKTQELRATKDTLLPAFSPDGRMLAWLKKNGRKSFQLQLSQID